jgi:peptidoglycan/xylan/chitin deacetylase (PgdA/CDA1 family)
MNLTPVKIPKVIKKLFSNFIWSIDTEEKTLYLTFDDGPTSEITEWVLDCLKAYNAKATFFCIGKNIEKHPSLFKHIIDDGHAIGNHTNNHIKGWKTSVKNYFEDVTDAQSTIDSQKSKTSTKKSQCRTLFRPPYGRIKPKQAKLLLVEGYQLVMWTVLSLDWDKNVSPIQCSDNVINNSKPGSIIVFHDSKKASRNMMYALPKVLDYFSKKGYSFKRIPE